MTKQRNDSLRESYHFQNSLPHTNMGRRKRKRFTMLHRFLALVFIAGGVSLGYFYFGTPSRPVPEEELPILSADRYDEGRDKLRVEEPEAPAGSSASSSIYTELEGGAPAKAAPSEQLLPSPETPQLTGSLDVDQPEAVPPGFDEYNTEERAEGIDTAVEVPIQSPATVHQARQPTESGVELAKPHDSTSVSQTKTVAQEPVAETPNPPAPPPAVMGPPRKSLQQALYETDVAITRKANAMVQAAVKEGKDMPSLIKSANDHIQIMPEGRQGAPKPTTKAAVLAAPGATYYLQLGSFQTKEAAEREQQRLQSLGSVREVIGQAGFKIMPISLGKDRGMVYCLHAGPVEREEALVCCQKLKSKNISCQARELKR